MARISLDVRAFLQLSLPLRAGPFADLPLRIDDALPGPQNKTNLTIEKSGDWVKSK